MWAKKEESELESRLGKRLSKLLKTLDIYGETGDIKKTAETLGITEETVERRLLVAAEEFENATKWVEKVDKYRHVLFRKESPHSRKIALLCKIGKALGYKTWIASNERSYLLHLDDRELVLGDLSDFWRKPKLLGVDIQTWNFLKFIDTMWIRNQRIHYAFEIETTTSFTKAFDRCSNIPTKHHAAKVIVIPRKRKRLLVHSVKSNLILHEIEKGNWYLLDFRALESFAKSNTRMDIPDFTDILERICT